MVSAQDVKKLRDKTGAGMMDCKKALIEANGNFEKAIDYLRKKGQKVSAARADKDTAEGSVFIQTNADNTAGTIIALSCETDFVAKTEDFQNLGQQIVDVACANQVSDIEALLALSIDNLSIREKITSLIGKVGEKITISACKSLRSSVVVTYLHGSKLGVLAGMEGAQGNEVVEAGQDVAMQIAAMNPLAIDKDGIDTAVIERELAVGKELARNEGKPEAMLEKIAQGRLNKFFKENTLLPQAFVKDNAVTIAQYLKGVAPNLTVTAFERVAIGS